MALAISTTITGLGQSPAQPARHNETHLDRAFSDAAAILDQSNECSRFFGTEATLVLSELLMTLKKEASNDHRVAFTMSGPFVVYAKGNTGAIYRLFQNAEVNVNGPFYRSKVFLSDPLVPNVGSFPPNTRQARVLILLHELAHLIQGNDGKWLIPDDGGNVERSRSNTRIVESKCGRQIRAL
jgi:hypothetical protein